jgi:hypothetical protein
MDVNKWMSFESSDKGTSVNSNKTGTITQVNMPILA